MKAPDIQSAESNSSPTLNNVNEEPSAIRNVQLKNSDLIVRHYADYENSNLDVSEDQDNQTSVEEDPGINYHKKGSSHQTLKNLHNEKSDLNLFKRNSIRQAMTNFHLVPAVNDGNKNSGRWFFIPNVKNSAGQYDANINFLKEDSKRQILSNSAPEEHIVDSNKESVHQNSPKDNTASQYELPQNFYKKDSIRQSLSNPNDVNDSFKQPERRSPPNSGKTENLYEFEDDIEKHTTQQYDRPTADERDYEVAEDDELPKTSPSTEVLVSSKDLKVKRDELSPLEYDKISKTLDTELNKMLASNESNPCSNCKVLKIENDELKSKIEENEEMDPR